MKWIEYPECLRYKGAYGEDYIVCSNCEAVVNIMDNCCEDWDYCPFCGERNEAIITEIVV